MLTQRLSRSFSLLSAFVGLFCLPPIFQKLFAFSSLNGGEIILLFVSSLFFFALSFAWYKEKVPANASALFFTFLCFTAAELGFRFSICLFLPQERANFAWQADRLNPEEKGYIGHPFIHFTGNPGKSLRVSRIFGEREQFNNYGFPGRDFHLQKDPAKIRIATIGGSTTHSGYPMILERLLNSRDDSIVSGNYEVFNFGLAWSTSAHMLANYMLLVRSFRPDILIIHQGWNDIAVRNILPEIEAMPDYSHVFQAFSPPRPTDAWMIRLSGLYRFLRHKVDPKPWWSFMGSALQKKNIYRAERKFDDLSELKFYQKNIETIIFLAELDKTKVILTTQPFQPSKQKNDLSWKHIAQTNEILRGIATKSDSLVFIDMAKELSGKLSSEFMDLAHVTDQGRLYKAEILMDQISALVEAKIR